MQTVKVPIQEKKVLTLGKLDKLKKQNKQITADIKQEAGHFQEVAAE